MKVFSDGLLEGESKRWIMILGIYVNEQHIKNQN